MEYFAYPIPVSDQARRHTGCDRLLLGRRAMMACAANHQTALAWSPPANRLVVGAG